MDREDIIKALKEEIEAVDSAEGKGVASPEPKEMKKPGTETKSEKIKLDGGGNTVGGDKGGVEKGGKPAEGCCDPAIEKADGKSVASAKVGEAKVGGGTDGKAIEKADGKSVESTSTGKAKFGGGTDGKAMEKADGKGVASATVKASPDLKGDNTVGESITLPHDVLVEMDGKQTTLKAGTKVLVVKEEEECKEEDEKCEKKEKKDKKVDESVVKEDELPAFMKNEGGEGGEGEEEAEEAGEGEEEAGEVDTEEVGLNDLPGMSDEEVKKIETEENESSLDKIVSSLEDLTSGFKEFAKEEQGEEEHGGEEKDDFNAQFESKFGKSQKVIK